jgi:uncharacterized membrane protein
MASPAHQFSETPPPIAQAHEAALWPVRAGEFEQRSSLMPLVALTVLATILRCAALNQQLWFDEITTLLDFVRQPLSHIVVTYSSENQHFLYSILAWASVNLFGDYPWTLRLPAVLFGVLSIPALYFLGRLFTTRTEALWACALMTVSYHHVWFSQNARGYTGVLFFALLCTYFFVRGAREGSPGIWVAYGVSAALGAYVHLSTGFIVAGQGMLYLWLLAARRREAGAWPAQSLRPMIGFLAAAAVTLLLYSPVMGEVLATTKLTQTQPAVRFEWSNPRWLIEETIRGLSGGMGAKGLLIVIPAGLVAFAGMVSHWRANRFAVGLMVLPGIATAGILLATGHNLWPRMFFFAIGFALLFLVRGTMCTAETVTARLGGGVREAQRLAAVLLILGLAASAWMLRAAYLYPKQDFAGAMEAVEAARQPGEPIVTVGLTTLPYRDYYKRNWNPVETAGELEALRARGSKVWLLYTSPIHLRARYPEIWNIIQAEFQTVRVFHGTLGNGEIYLCQAQPRRD